MRDDFRNVRRSYIVLGVIGVFAGIIALVFASEMNIYDDPYRTLYDVSAFVAYAFPLFIASLTYIAIAGDISRGSIKYMLGLPNSRLEYFVGKYISRASVAVIAVLFGTAVGFVVAAATFTNSADLGRFLKFAGASIMYALAIVGIFIGISAMTHKRSRAMFMVIGAYFILVVFWVGLLPFLSLNTVIDAVASTLGVTVSQPTRELIRVLSPATAYFQTTTEVYTGVYNQYNVFSFSPNNQLANQTWFSILVMAGWAILVPLLGYAKFRVSELG